MNRARRLLRATSPSTAAQGRRRQAAMPSTVRRCATLAAVLAVVLATAAVAGSPAPAPAPAPAAPGALAHATASLQPGVHLFAYRTDTQTRVGGAAATGVQISCRVELRVAAVADAAAGTVHVTMLLHEPHALPTGAAHTRWVAARCLRCPLAGRTGALWPPTAPAMPRCA